MKTAVAKSYLDRDELINFLKDSILPSDKHELHTKKTQYELGYMAAILDVLNEVEGLL